MIRGCSYGKNLDMSHSRAIVVICWAICHASRTYRMHH